MCNLFSLHFLIVTCVCKFSKKKKSSVPNGKFFFPSLNDYILPIIGSVDMFTFTANKCIFFLNNNFIWRYSCVSMYMLIWANKIYRWEFLRLAITNHTWVFLFLLAIGSLEDGSSVPLPVESGSLPQSQPVFNTQVRTSKLLFFLFI